MTGLAAGELDRRITILRGGTTDDGLSVVPAEPVPDIKRWAKKTDVSDGERVRAGQQGLEMTSRFVVRSDSLTRTLTSRDTLICGDVSYAITGIKECRGRNVGIEITALAQPDVHA